MEELSLTLLNYVIYITLIAFYIGLLYLTKRQSKIVSRKQHHYILNLASMVIIITSLITPLNTWLGYSVACTILIIELHINHILIKNTK